MVCLRILHCGVCLFGSADRIQGRHCVIFIIIITRLLLIPLVRRVKSLLKGLDMILLEKFTQK